MNSINHKITKSEIEHGILIMRVSDGTREFFAELPTMFSVELKGVKISNRRISSQKIWMGFTQMEQFNPEEIVKISKKNNYVVME